jgi:methyl-accepting chemotaxis protein
MEITSHKQMAMKSRNVLTAGTLLTGAFVILAVSLAASLAIQFSQAWSELEKARRAGTLAAADAAIFQTTQMLRVSRANTQTLIASADQPLPEIKRLIAQNDAQLKLVDGVVDTNLAKNVSALMGKVHQITAKARELEAGVVALAAKPKAERDVKDSQAWYEALGAIATGLTDVSRSIAGEARLADPVIGEYVLARQYSWSARDSFGTECAINRQMFSNGAAIDAKARLQVATLRGESGRSLTMLDDLLSRTDAPRALTEAAASARRVFTDAYAARDAAYATSGTAGAPNAAGWTQVCNTPIEQAIKVAEAALVGMAQRAEERQSAAFGHLVLIGSSLLAGILGCALGLWMIRKRVVAPVRALTLSIGRLAERDFKIKVPTMNRADEFGAMAKTLEDLRLGALNAEELVIEQAGTQAAQVERGQRLEGLVKGFETKAEQLVGLLVKSSVELEGTAKSMSSTAGRTNQQAATVATAAQHAGIGVQTVATAAEELSSSIAEIARQVAHSTSITGKAVEDARRTDGIVRALADSAQKIGDVVGLISNIASQTNLLALNATIEAARAGESGRGFAVVATEVKALAQQTAKATDDIGNQVKQIQSATQEAVEAIRAIGSTIDEVNGITAAIGAAVEEQGAATAEIARNVQQTATSTDQVTRNIAGVSQAANETGSAASDVLDAAGQVSRQSESILDEVNRFITGVRAA